MESEPIFCAEQIKVPAELPQILKEFTKEVIRKQPKNVYDFSAKYFAKMSATAAAGGVDSAAMFSVEMDQLIALKKSLQAANQDMLSLEAIEAACKAASFPMEAKDAVLRLLQPKKADVAWQEFATIGITFACTDLPSVMEHLFIVFDESTERSAASTPILGCNTFRDLFSVLQKFDHQVTAKLSGLVEDLLNQGEPARTGFLRYGDLIESDLGRALA